MESVIVTFNLNYPGGKKHRQKIELQQIETFWALYSKSYTRYGYNLEGWYMDADCTVVMKSENIIDDIEVYASWKAWSDQEKAAYDAYLEEIHYANDISLRPLDYTPDSFMPYLDLSTRIMLEIVFYDYPVCGDIIQRQTVELGVLRSQLIASGSEQSAYYIWGDSMPVGTQVDDFALTFTNPDFRPFLVPYLVEDQKLAKGNIIVIAGGGYAMRCNMYEGYNVAEYYRDKGYNAFVLQRRIVPYHAIDAHMDLQRAIRYIRYNAYTLGISATDRIAAIGFSGGGSTITGMLMDHYGLISPQKYDETYVPDDVDNVNSDLQTTLFIYGTFGSIEGTDNNNMPSAFIVTGEKDEHHADAASVQRYLELHKLGVSAELHIFKDARHGFGMGDGFCDSVKEKPMPVDGVNKWPEMSLAFLDVAFGKTSR